MPKVVLWRECDCATERLRVPVRTQVGPSRSQHSHFVPRPELAVFLGRRPSLTAFAEQRARFLGRRPALTAFAEERARFCTRNWVM